MELERHADERDFKLLENDRYTFAVLSRILPGSCSVTLTDHERFILCHSVAPYPVWLWTPDDLSGSEKQRAWETADSVCPLASGFSYNLKYDLADFFIAKASEQGINVRVITNMFAYDCPAPIAPTHPAEGHLYRCTEEDIDTVADMILAFHESVGDARFDPPTCRQIAAGHIAGHFYFWKNAEGEIVACCSFHPSGDLASVGSVYTAPAHRRKHYAQQMVYEVTRLIAKSGLTPMLYTDADYAASNACYEKIGYVLRGKLCTIKAE
ncbi:MAG: GNAT family N-acetyltransferase [Clostridia bacterium]|nr:GNAT family N-acetyltransferase [Clostridia bacterium]MBR6668872.1 GNAT family N-acetyltransferase [Clostridia bacterium]